MNTQSTITANRRLGKKACGAIYRDAFWQAVNTKEGAMPADYPEGTESARIHALGWEHGKDYCGIYPRASAEFGATPTKDLQFDSRIDAVRHFQAKHWNEHMERTGAEAGAAGVPPSGNPHVSASSYRNSAEYCGWRKARDQHAS